MFFLGQAIDKLEEQLQNAGKSHLDKVRNLVEKKVNSSSSSSSSLTSFDVKSELLGELTSLAAALAQAPAKHLRGAKPAVEKLFVVQHLVNAKNDLSHVMERYIESIESPGCNTRTP